MWRMTTPTATKHPAGHCVLDKSARIRLAQAADAVVKSFYKRLPPPSPQCIVALFVASMNVGIHSLRGYQFTDFLEFSQKEGQKVTK